MWCYWQPLLLWLSCMSAYILQTSSELMPAVRLLEELGNTSAGQSNRAQPPSLRIACLVYPPENSKLDSVVENVVSGLSALYRSLVFRNIDHPSSAAPVSLVADDILTVNVKLLHRIESVILDSISHSYLEGIMKYLVQQTFLDCTSDVLMTEYALQSVDYQAKAPPESGPVNSDSTDFATAQHSRVGNIPAKRRRSLRPLRRLGHLDLAGGPTAFSRMATHAFGNLPTALNSGPVNRSPDSRSIQHWDRLMAEETAAKAKMQSEELTGMGPPVIPPLKELVGTPAGGEAESASRTGVSKQTEILSIWGPGQPTAKKKKLLGPSIVQITNSTNIMLVRPGSDPSSLLVSGPVAVDPLSALQDPLAAIKEVDFNEINYKTYTTAKKATEIMNKFENARKNGSDNPFVKFVNLLDIATQMDSAAATRKNPTGRQIPSGMDVGSTYLSPLARANIQQATYNQQQMQMVNVIIGAGFDTAMGMMEAQQSRQRGQQPPRARVFSQQQSQRLLQQQADDFSQHGNPALSNQYVSDSDEKVLPLNRQAKGKKQHSNKPDVIKAAQIARQEETEQKRRLYAQQKLPFQQTNPGHRRRLVEDSVSGITYDNVLAHIAGCDCKEHPDGASCYIQEARNITVACHSLAVWSHEGGGALLSDVLRAIDYSMDKGVDTIMLPIWFGSFTNQKQRRQAPRVLYGALQRAGAIGIVIGLSAGDEGIVGEDNDETRSLPCSDLPGMAVLCASSIDINGEVSEFANVPPQETVFATGEAVPLFNRLFSGTGASMAKAIGIFHTVKVIAGEEAKPYELLAMLYNPVRRVRFPRQQPGKTQDQSTDKFVAQGGVLDATRAAEIAMIFSNQLPDDVRLEDCFKVNVLLVGAELSPRLSRATAEECQKACSEELECKFFNFNEMPENNCVLFTAIDSAIYSLGFVAGERVCSTKEELKAALKAQLESNLQAVHSLTDPGAAQALDAYTDDTPSGLVDGKRFMSAETASRKLSRSAESPTGNPSGNGAKEAVSLLQTTQALFEAGSTFMRVVPLQQYWRAGQLLYNKRFLGNRGMKTFWGPGLGVEKQSLMPPPGAGKPNVLCHRQGMTCCVPRQAVTDWKNDPPHLNGSPLQVCTATFVTMQQAMCATTSYNGQTCGMMKTETRDYVVYKHTLTIPGRSMNNVICICREKKPTSDSEGGRIIEGTAQWEYSVQAVSSANKQKGHNIETLGKGVTTALAFAHMVSDTGNAALNGAGEMITQYPPARRSHDIISGVTGLLRPRLTDGLRGRNLQSATSNNLPCLTPWPMECKAWKSECEENSNLRGTSLKCQPVDLVVQGCPYEELNFKVNDQQPGMISFSLGNLRFAGNVPFRIGCSYRLLECGKATVDDVCAANLNYDDTFSFSTYEYATDSSKHTSQMGMAAADALLKGLLGSSIGDTIDITSFRSALERRCTVITFGGQGLTVLESWVNKVTGQPKEAAKIIGYAGSFSDEDLENCDKFDIDDFQFSSKMEVLPNKGNHKWAGEGILLDKYQVEPGSRAVELEMRKTRSKKVESGAIATAERQRAGPKLVPTVHRNTSDILAVEKSKVPGGIKDSSLKIPNTSSLSTVSSQENLLAGVIPNSKTALRKPSPKRSSSNAKPQNTTPDLTHQQQGPTPNRKRSVPKETAAERSREPPVEKADFNGMEKNVTGEVPSNPMPWHGTYGMGPKTMPKTPTDDFGAGTRSVPSNEVVFVGLLLSVSCIVWLW